MASASDEIRAMRYCFPVAAPYLRLATDRVKWRDRHKLGLQRIATMLGKATDFHHPRRTRAASPIWAARPMASAGSSTFSAAPCAGRSSTAASCPAAPTGRSSAATAPPTSRRATPSRPTPARASWSPATACGMGRPRSWNSWRGATMSIPRLYYFRTVMRFETADACRRLAQPHSGAGARPARGARGAAGCLRGGMMASGSQSTLPASLVAEREGAVAILRLNRPQKRNALDDETILGIEHVLHRAARRHRRRAARTAKASISPPASISPS